MEIRISNLLSYFYLGIFLLIVSSVSLFAQVETRLGLKFYGSFIYSEKVPNALFFFNDIQQNDGFELRKAMRNHEIEILVLSSRGGSVFEGLNMAGIIHDKQLITYVPKTDLEGAGKCASACAFMFFAGKTRKAEGKIGVHQFYSGASDETASIGKTQKIAQFTVSEIIGFLNEFETPPFVYERMFQQSEMYYFDKKEMLQIERSNVAIQQNNLNNINNFIAEFKIEILALKKKLNNSELVKKTKPNTDNSPQEPITTVKRITKKTTLAPTETQQKSIIKKVQKELNRLNCSAGTADGVIGRKTRAALENLNKSTNSNFSISQLSQDSFVKKLSIWKTKNGCKKSQVINTNTLYFEHKEAFRKGTKVRNWPYDQIIARVVSFEIKGRCGSKEIKETWYGIDDNIRGNISYHLVGPTRPNWRINVRSAAWDKLNKSKTSENIFGNGYMEITQLSPKIFTAWGAGCRITGKLIK